MPNLQAGHDAKFTQPHRLSHAVLRITHHPVPFRGSTIVPTISFSRALNRFLPVYTRATVKRIVLDTFGRGRTPRQPYSPNVLEKRSETLRTRLRGGPAGRQRGAFRPILASAYRPNLRSERCSHPFSDSFLTEFSEVAPTFLTLHTGHVDQLKAGPTGPALYVKEVG
jgi:hypothetical protein